MLARVQASGGYTAALAGKLPNLQVAGRELTHKRPQALATHSCSWSGAGGCRASRAGCQTAAGLQRRVSSRVVEVRCQRWLGSETVGRSMQMGGYQLADGWLDVQPAQQSSKPPLSSKRMHKRPGTACAPSSFRSKDRCTKGGNRRPRLECLKAPRHATPGLPQ